MTDAAQARSEVQEAVKHLAERHGKPESYCDQGMCWTKAYDSIDRALAAARLEQAEKMVELYERAPQYGRGESLMYERNRLRRLAGGSNG